MKLVNFFSATLVLLVTGQPKVLSFLVPTTTTTTTRTINDNVYYRSIRLKETNAIMMIRKQNNIRMRKNQLQVNSLPNAQKSLEEHSWSPQDLTKNLDGFEPIPNDDYIKLYQKNPNLWPIEFFVIPYRRIVAGEKKVQTQILVRKSANGTSKYGLGTGVPVTRWMLSSRDGEEEQPPKGYRVSQPKQIIDARIFPEFPEELNDSWSYTKIDMCEDAFQQEFIMDEEVEDYAKVIRQKLLGKFNAEIKENDNLSNSFLFQTTVLVRDALEKENSIAAIALTLRMSGLFSKRKIDEVGCTDDDQKVWARYLNINDKVVDPNRIVESARIYTMFPQMPNPLPLPLSTPEELRKEIENREDQMKLTGRDPHKDQYGRIYTHKSTSNVSNTIHGVYLPLDVTGVDNLDCVPAFDLFGVNMIEREWVSLEDLKVLDSEGVLIGTEDTKPTFISGFILRQLIKDGGVIHI